VSYLFNLLKGDNKMKYCVLTVVFLLIFASAANADRDEEELTPIASFRIEDLPSIRNVDSLEIRPIVGEHKTPFDIVVLDRANEIVFTSYDIGQWKGLLSPVTSVMAAMMVDGRLRQLTKEDRKKLEQLLINDVRFDQLISLYKEYLISDRSKLSLNKFHNLMVAIKELNLQKLLRSKPTPRPAYPGN
jgi:hypothetical protein